MADKQKFTVNRSMQDGATSYKRGDTREMAKAEAKPLLDSGALSLPGKKPGVREGAVRHTFGEAPSSDAGYISAATGSVVLAREETAALGRGTVATGPAAGTSGGAKKPSGAK